MFFDDPVGAFSNLRRSLAHGGRLAFVSWQGLPANEWLTVIADEVAKQAEIPDFGGLAKGPGMFALKDPEEMTALLEAAGFADVGFEPLAPHDPHWRGRHGRRVDGLPPRDGDGPRSAGLAGTDCHDDVVEAVRSSLTEH